MKKLIIIFELAAILVLIASLWILIAHFNGDFQDILTISIVTIFVGFAIFIGFDRIRSIKSKEPCEDELSKKIMTKASSLAFYISVFFWVFLMFISSSTTMETHSLIGTGIMGMSLIFFLSWAGVKFFGFKNG